PWPRRRLERATRGGRAHVADRSRYVSLRPGGRRAQCIPPHGGAQYARSRRPGPGAADRPVLLGPVTGSAYRGLGDWGRAGLVHRESRRLSPDNASTHGSRAEVAILGCTRCRGRPREPRDRLLLASGPRVSAPRARAGRRNPVGRPDPARDPDDRSDGLAATSGDGRVVPCLWEEGARVRAAWGRAHDPAGRDLHAHHSTGLGGG